MRVIRTSRLSVPVMEIVYPFNTYAMEHQTVPMDTMKICVFALQVSQIKPFKVKHLEMLEFH